MTWTAFAVGIAGSLVCLAVILPAALDKHPSPLAAVFALFLAVFSYMPLFCWRYFETLHDALCGIRISKLAKTLVAERGGGPTMTVRWSRFLFSRDLVDLEDRIRRSLLRQIDEIRKGKRQQTLELQSAHHKLRHDAIDEEIERLATETGEIRRARKALGKNLSLSAKRSVLYDMLVIARKESRSATADQDARLQRLVDRLVETSEGTLCEEANQLYALAKNASDPKTKVRFMQQAIEEQKKATIRPVPQATSVTLADAPKPPEYLQAVPLWDYARQIFVIGDLLPNDVDERMATGIILLLVGPGNRQRIFQAKYWPETRLRNEVIAYYQRTFGESYRPASFEKTLRWLLAERILSSKPKSNGLMCSLTSRPAEGNSANSQEIILRVIKVTNELKN